MGKSKKKKKKSSSKSSYDEKKKSLKAPSQRLPEKDIEVDILQKEEEVVEAAEPEVQKSETATEEPAVPADPPMTAAPEVEIPYDPDFSEEDFSSSVSELKAEDIHMPDTGNTEAKKPKKKISRTENIIQLILLVICGTVAAVCIFMLGQNIWGKIKGQELYSNTTFDGFTLEDSENSDSRNLAYTGSDTPLMTLFDRINSKESSVTEDTSGKYDEQLAQMRASLSALKAQYENIYGWIYVPGTNINHPVMRCDDNNFYLTHAHTGEYLPIGAIFADLSTADVVTDNYNTVIYGHNVVSQGQSSMFHDVEKFLDSEFFNSTDIYVYTMDGAYIFEPVAIYDTVADDFYFKTIFSSGHEFELFAEEKVSRSNIYTGAVFTEEDRMLTLSTCTNGAQDGRYALHAKLIEIIK